MSPKISKKTSKLKEPESSPAPGPRRGQRAHLHPAAVLGLAVPLLAGGRVLEQLHMQLDVPLPLLPLGGAEVLLLLRRRPHRDGLEGVVMRLDLKALL